VPAGRMLSAYRRHKQTCKLAKVGVAATKCSCPIWAYGSVNGRQVRCSLKTRDWTHATTGLIKLEAGKPDEAATVPDVVNAIESYLNDCAARHIAAETLRSYRSTLTTFAKWCKERKLTEIQDLAVATFSDYRATPSHSENTVQRDCTFESVGRILR
jgi:Phage integrase, N-terminal SAM-like domain